MKLVSHLSVLLAWVVVLLLVSFFTWPGVIADDLSIHSKSFVQISEPLSQNILPVQRVSTTSLLFVGDIMLGRGVESIIEANEISYPFTYMKDILDSADLTVGNFEGIVSEHHVHAPSMTFQFSIKPEYLTMLQGIGFDVLSLANNHSYDYGVSAFLHTQELCVQEGLSCMGSPYEVGALSYEVYKINEERVGVLFIHTLFTKPNIENIYANLASLTEISDVQFAYIHWGEEYALVHNTEQETLAHMLVDAGVDGVIGHHPHVVQDIEIYKERMIIYSLGNFIFDQYFSDDVLQGLMVNLEITPTDFRYSLKPIETYTTHIQPRFMENEMAQILLERIVADANIQTTKRDNIRVITLQR
jgi:poly-gamma-glutamate synthesis protein (capsule biosynthesis protein)